MNHIDVVVVGAGISGIGAAYNLKTRCPQKSFTILEGRANIGGTWDLFKYPGIRSDSDMHTMGFKFKPWNSPKTIADGPAILSYLEETIEENDLRKKIQFNKKVIDASWSSIEALWTLEVEDQSDKTIEKTTCNILYLCGGYYNYDKGYTPEFKGVENFKGQIIHPQKWPEDLDYTGKEVVIIGSGATAVTIVPSMAEKVKHITMLQRSPTYYFAAPDEDVIGNFIKKFTTNRLGYFLVRWKNILLGRFMLSRMRKNPEKIKTQLIDQVRDHLGEDYDVDKHFTPRYMPWDQRLCLVPNGDIFNAINSGKASVVTDTIDTFTEEGIKLDSGEELEADIIITATGLNMQLLNGINIKIDNETLDISKKLQYKTMMFSDVPNLIATFGYTTASWTLGADLISEYACKLINLLDKKGCNYFCPQSGDDVTSENDYLDLSSGYIERVKHQLPKQGSRDPWINTQDYLKDITQIRFKSLEDQDLKFKKAG
ncbi:NAD(P)/FAD-dependent oxidoreductase [Gammaproteobacteria bacterium]|jgi:cation diffusion facilitator CzcD-associated flavoprotein CzcO|nr:NAD(P)/FAD-dependent oxidoreductase [Gammaproteobacteria bacterium]